MPTNRLILNPKAPPRDRYALEMSATGSTVWIRAFGTAAVIAPCVFLASERDAASCDTLRTMRNALAEDRAAPAFVPEAQHVAAVVTAAQAMLDEFGGDCPDWLQAAAEAMQSALGGYWAKREHVSAPVCGER